MPNNRRWKTRIFCATSLNGYLARSDHSLTWLTSPSPNPSHPTPTPSSSKATPTFEEHMATVDFIVMGRQTFDVCMSFQEWPYPKEKELLVLSRTLGSIPEEQMEVKGLVAAKVRVIRSMEEAEAVLDAEATVGRMVYVDGGETGREFLRRGWVDEVVLTVAPVVLAGGGRGLFGSLGEELEEDLELTLVGVDIIEHGMVTVYYKVKGPEA
ncbi:dihydrofolate reductase-like domain-containing protein [Aspergillus granulosus]|uniref:2,5-diamino-6-ribosylamino-4(3H)-pyrimidinone 5'-phosphate reductase n=1 Tax=Aspergillus granulosus TaxID=176169 RepID=A0ABR4H5V1_9EURO